jgi:hypothetical protein
MSARLAEVVDVMYSYTVKLIVLLAISNANHRWRVRNNKISEEMHAEYKKLVLSFINHEHCAPIVP